MIKAGITVFSGDDPGIKLELTWDHDDFKAYTWWISDLVITWP